MKVLIVGDPFSISGYSLVCRELAMSLIKAGVDVSIKVNIMDRERYQDFHNASTLKDVVNKNNQAEVSVQVCNPLMFNPSICKKNIGLFFYEASELPKHFVDKCNQMDGIIAPSQFVAKVCRLSGVTVPVFIAHGYVEEKPFTKTNWKEMLDIPEDNKMMLSCFQWSYRKGWDILLRSYWGAFNRDDNVTLVMKVYAQDTSEEAQQAIINDINKLKSMFVISGPNGQSLPDLPEFRLIMSKLTDEAMDSLYDACDIFVLPSRGEGWGRPTLEAMLHGKPVIATNWGAMSEFLTKENSYPLQCEVEPCMASNGYIYPITSFFAAPSVLWLSRIMTYLVNGVKDENDQFLAEKARECALSFSEETSANEHIAAIACVVAQDGKPVVAPNITMV